MTKMPKKKEKINDVVFWIGLSLIVLGIGLNNISVTLSGWIIIFSWANKI